MTFGAHYKGDVSEVTMGHETGLYLQHSEPFTWTAVTAAGNDYTEITLGGTVGATGSLGLNGTTGILSVPLGMLIGNKMTFHGNSGNFSSYYYEAVSGRTYTIVDHTFATYTKIKIMPALAVGTISSAATDVMFLHSLGLPTYAYSTEFVMHAQADTSKEFSLIDQFVGLASFMTLPDTTVDIHKYHVVGLGRQAAVQQTGKVHHTGGSLEMPLHNARWLYYSLGRDVVDYANCGTSPSEGGTQSQPNLLAAISAGQVYVDLPSANFPASTGGGHTAVASAVGDYILIKDETRTPTTTYKAPNLESNHFWPVASSGGLASEDEHFEWTETSEVRRITAMEAISGGVRFFIDDPWAFSHLATCDAFLREAGDNDPTVHADRTIQNEVKHLIFSSDTIPSFCIEHSIRNRDMGSYSQEAGSAAPAATTDSKQLTRVFRGCKIVEWELSSTVDAELKYRAIFDALSCYTDTGRLEPANKGDRYTAHRMFQNTATNATERVASGIASGTEKPFMFYNGTIKAFGGSIGMVTAFELRGKTGVELFHTIQGTSVAETVDSNNLSIKQVPYGGVRNPSIIREGREEFEMEIDVVLTDATLWHQLRSHVEQSAAVGAVGDAAGFIELHFTKPVTGATGQTPSLRVILDDYVITEAPIPMPDDKGLLHSKIRLEPRNVKVMSTDATFHY